MKNSSGDILLANATQDTVAPTVTNVKASTIEPTNESVIVTAEFTDDIEVSSKLYRIGETNEWKTYPAIGVVMLQNATIYFKAVDTSGNESEVASCAVTNIEKTYEEIISGRKFEDDEVRGIGSGQLYLDATIHDAVVYVYSGGVVSRTTVASAGCSRYFNTWLVVNDGGMALDTTVNSGGELDFFGGYANGAVINAGGVLGFASGTATNISAEKGAYFGIRVAPGGYLQGVSAGNAFEIKDGVISSMTINWTVDIESGGTAINDYFTSSVSISSGGIAISNTITDWNGLIRVYGGALANDTVVEYGSLYISRGGLATGTTVNHGRMHVSNGGVANSAIINSGGCLVVSSGGTVTNITASSGAQLKLHVAPDTYVQGA